MEFILKSALLIGILYSFYKLFLQKETFFKSIRLYFIIGLIATVVLPIISIPIYVEAIVVETFVPEIIENFNNHETTVIDEVTTTKAVNKINWIALLTNIYFIGILFFSIKFLIEIISLYRLIHQSDKQKNDKITFAETIKNISPFSIFNYIVYNKNKFTETELAHIIIHEKVHVKHLHTYDMLLVHLLVIIQWFNPFAWLYKKDLQQNLEFLADKYAQENVNTLKEYQYLLLKTSVQKNPFALSTNFYNSLIKKRIIMLQKTPSKKLNQLKYVFIIPLLVLFLYAFNTKEISKPINNELFPNLNFIEKNDTKTEFINPIHLVNVIKISSEYGKQKNPFTKKEQFHKGIDIIAHKGTDVYATANGNVIKATYDKLKGNYIQIKHANNYQTNYHHLGDIQVALGEQVKAGVTISTVGNSGKSTGTHLHYEVVKNDENVNPQSFLTYKIKNKLTKKIEINNNIIDIEISKNTSQEQLNQIKKDLKAEGITINFKKIKRNKQGEIISIKIDAKNENSNISYSSSDDDGIKEITLKIEGNHISIGNTNSHNMHFTSNNDVSYFISNKKHKKHKIKSFHFDSDDDKHSKHKIIDININSDNNNNNNNNNNDATFIIDDEDNATFIINGKKMTKEAFEKMDKSKIKTIEIKSDSDNIVIDTKGKSKHIKIITENEENHNNGHKKTNEIRIIKSGDTNGNSFFYEINDDDDKNTITTYKVNGKKMTKEEFEKMDKSKIKDLEINKEKKIKKKE